MVIDTVIGPRYPLDVPVYVPSTYLEVVAAFALEAADVDAAVDGVVDAEAAADGTVGFVVLCVAGFVAVVEFEMTV